MPPRPNKSKSSSTSDASTWTTVPAATQGPGAYGLNLNSAESLQLYHHFTGRVDTLSMQFGALRTEMRGEVSGVLANLREMEAARAQSEAARSIELSEIIAGLNDVRSNLPTKGTIWKGVAATVVGIITLLAFIWAVFDTGGSFAGSFADSILGTKQSQQRLENKLDKALEERGNGQANGVAVQPPPESNVVGNRS